MGRGDNRLTLKMRQRKNQKRKNLKLREKIEGSKPAARSSKASKKREEEK